MFDAERENARIIGQLLVERCVGLVSKVVKSLVGDSREFMLSLRIV